MSRMFVADGDDIRAYLADIISGIGRARVDDNDSLFALYAKTGIT